ncbi:hypothetical protein N6H18_06850 [Reichenbachiella agarivorans]|uniref:Addiction module component n=1 Tax=Reichenbachiella agarivorans TaxID=2979464 RepID=A0ABY6CUJ9_9BACT|nr:hypothetical protein [Reichenbachiella agarivorans]UXP33670.1 hypothetical protein N6H18_06850 [Reichenbachiella agarivorans]
MIAKIIRSEDDRVLAAIQSILEIDDETDFWDDLNTEDQAAIQEGLAQLDAGQHVSSASVRLEIKDRFNF